MSDIKLPETRVERVEGTNNTNTEAKKYQDEVKKNREGLTRVTRQEKAKKANGKDCGESESTKSFDDAVKKDPTILTRIKNAVKKW